MCDTNAPTPTENVPIDNIGDDIIIATTSAPVRIETTNELFSRVSTGRLSFRDGIFTENEKYYPNPTRVGKIEIFKRTLDDRDTLTKNYLESEDFMERNVITCTFDNAGNIHQLDFGFLHDEIVGWSLQQFYRRDIDDSGWPYASFMNAFSSDLVNSSQLLRNWLCVYTKYRDMYVERDCTLYACAYSELRAARHVYENELPKISSMWDADESIVSHNCQHDVCAMHNGTVYKLYNLGTVLFLMDEYYKSFMKQFPKK